MKLCIRDMNLYSGNVYVCHLSVRDGEELKPGKYEAEIRYSHCFGRDLPFVEGIGWLGGDGNCNVIVGRVRSRESVIPCLVTESRIANMLESCAERGERITLEVFG